MSWQESDVPLLGMPAGQEEKNNNPLLRFNTDFSTPSKHKPYTQYLPAAGTHYLHRASLPCCERPGCPALWVGKWCCSPGSPLCLSTLLYFPFSSVPIEDDHSRISKGPVNPLPGALSISHCHSRPTAMLLCVPLLSHHQLLEAQLKKASVHTAKSLLFY